MRNKYPSTNFGQDRVIRLDLGATTDDTELRSPGKATFGNCRVSEGVDKHQESAFREDDYLFGEGTRESSAELEKRLRSSKLWDSIAEQWFE